MFRESPDAIGISRGRLIVAANPALVELVGASSDAELLGKSFLELMTPAARAAMEAQVARRVAGAPVTGSYPAAFRRGAGGEVRAQVTTTTFRVDAELWWFALVRPTGTGTVEELYREVFSESSAIKLLIDPVTGRIEDANPAAVRFYGWSLVDLREKNIRDINQLTAEEVGARMRDVAAGAHQVFQFRHLTASGAVRDVEVHSGRVQVLGRTRLLSIVHDVTERVALEARVREAQRLEAIGLVAGSVAHDFANLHTVLLACADSLDAALSGDVRVSGALQQLVAATRRAGDLTHSLLGAGGDLTRQPGPVADLSALVREAMAMVRAAAPDLPVEVRAAAGAWAAIGPDQVERVLLNLVLNARDAQARRVTIEVGGDDAFVHLAVADDGAGMSEDVRRRAFEPFFTTRPGRGHGFGLASVRGIARCCGGSVEVVSSPGAGARFVLTLPRAERPANRVMLVDDEPEIREVLEQSLRLQGFEVTSFPDAERVLSLSVEELRTFSFLVTDQRMPGRSGIALAREVCGRHPDCRVVVVSGDLSAAERAELASDWAFLHKPFSGRDLALTLRRR